MNTSKAPKIQYPSLPQLYLTAESYPHHPPSPLHQCHLTPQQPCLETSPAGRSSIQLATLSTLHLTLPTLYSENNTNTAETTGSHLSDPQSTPHYTTHHEPAQCPPTPPPLKPLLPPLPRPPQNPQTHPSPSAPSSTPSSSPAPSSPSSHPAN